MTTQKPLAKAFDARKSFFAHRASSVFPLRIREQCDLHIVFMNYWLLKNNISHIGVNFRVYDTHGTLKARQSLESVESHNEVSVREVVLAPNAIELPFDGMIEVEVVSTENIAFPFPAIMGIYEANGFFSAVHAAGRIKNPDEHKKPQRSEETNWTCKFEGSVDSLEVVPFFHYFVGATPLRSDDEVVVNLRNSSGAVISSKTMVVGDMPPFSSRIFFADEIFSLSDIPPQGSFMSVALNASDVFPRLVVGNYHKAIDFLEVTHSFPVTEFTDYCPPIDDTKPEGSFPSLLAAQTARGLELQVRVFPTNCSGSVQASISTKLYGDNRLKGVQEHFEFKSDPGEAGLAFTLDADEEMRVLHLEGNTIPSRLNASYLYSVSGTPHRFSTDIATGAKSIVYPPKWRHWGHGCIGGGFDTYILYRNNTHSPLSTAINSGDIRILGKGIDHVLKFDVAAESCAALLLSEILGLDPVKQPPTFVSWLMSMTNPVGETFWVAFRPDGAVFGEHGF